MAREPEAASTPEARVLSIRKLFLLGRFEPARAQRDYQWEEAQWSDLWSDLTSAFRYAGPADEPKLDIVDHDDEEVEDDHGDGDDETEESFEPAPPVVQLARPQRLSHYYLGHVLLLPRERRGDLFLIYDGQQRLTTLTLLLCALRDADGGEGDWLAIQEVLRTPAPEKRPRLTISTRGGTLARIVETLFGTVPERTGKAERADHLMYKAAGFFLQRMKRWGRDMRRAFADFILDSVFVTGTIMPDRRVAEYAYITINTRGTPLQSKDIVKGHFIQLASRRSLTDATSMSDGWDRLENSAGKYLDSILRTAFLLYCRRPPTFDFGVQLMDYFGDESRLEEAKDWVGSRLPWLVALHRANILVPQKRAVTPPPFASLRRLNFLPFSHWQALAFRFAIRDRRAKKRFAQSVRKLERWGFRMNLLDVDEDKIAEIVISALHEIDARRDPFRGALRIGHNWRENIRARLHDGQITDDARRGAHVRWLETLYWPEDKVDFTATTDVSVEHVLPQSAAGQWLTDFPEARHIHTEQWGNLCLIPKKMNLEIGNGPYAQKREAFLSLPGVYKSAHDVAASSLWTMKAVQERTDRLRKKAIQALGLNVAQNQAAAAQRHTVGAERVAE